MPNLVFTQALFVLATATLAPTAVTQTCATGQTLLKNDILPATIGSAARVGVVPGLCATEAGAVGEVAQSGYGPTDAQPGCACGVRRPWVAVRPSMWGPARWTCIFTPNKTSNTGSIRKDALDLFEVRHRRGIVSQVEVAQVRSEYEAEVATIPAGATAQDAPGDLPRGAGTLGEKAAGDRAGDVAGQEGHEAIVRGRADPA